jgi:hypothetical protein
MPHFYRREIKCVSNYEWKDWPGKNENDLQQYQQT